jgi:hypothetical protein
VLPGGFSPRPQFSRFARRAVTGKALSLRCKSHQLESITFIGRQTNERRLSPNLCNSTSRVRSMNEGSTGDSAPSEARKRGSGGESPRKHDDLLTGPWGSL